MPNIIKLVILNVEIDVTAKMMPVGFVELIHQIYQSGLQIVIQHFNANVCEKVKHLLTLAELPTVKIYNAKALIPILEAEKVLSNETVIITSSKEKYDYSFLSDITTINFSDEDTFTNIAATCRSMNITKYFNRPLPHDFNRGKYPSLLGLHNNSAVKYVPETKTYALLDITNNDGNLHKRCEYESMLAQLVVNEGRKYWQQAYHKINQLFLDDFDLKSDPVRVHAYQEYIAKVKSSLETENVIHDGQSVRDALVNLFNDEFDLTNVSQFYYHIWLASYGHEHLEPFVFLIDLLNPTTEQHAPIQLLTMFPNIANDVDQRKQAYASCQPFLTCGTPQLRGRQPRPDKKLALTWGIVRDNDSDKLISPPHYSAKSFFMPVREHPVAKELESKGAPIIGGPSGTLGRNILMLAPLVQVGRISHLALQQYVMGMASDLVNRGHHSYEEIGLVSNVIINSLNPSLDPVRDPIPYYEQFLTSEFIQSDCYIEFKRKYNDYFIAPIELASPAVKR